MRGCWYYIKLRPGLEEFLEKVAQLFELHIYTMGTRAYAQQIANIIDPTRKLFGDRILSRDESGSLTAKNLQRLFPVDTKMVVIIDDRGDVWRWNPNLIKVSPYDFFVGIGDINSSFLPQKQDIGETSKVPVKAIKEKPSTEHHVNGATAKPEAGTEVSALEQLVSMGGGDNPMLLKEQTHAQEETILHQVEDRPLLQKQKELEAEDDASAESSEDSVDESQEPIKPRHHLLEDHDRELYQLQDRLEQVHTSFFEEYDKKRSRALGGRVAELKGEKAASKGKGVDLKLVPDVKEIMPLIKRRVLGGVVLVFSGVLPLGTDTQNADISLWAKSFGAVIAPKINTRTTHLVAGRNRTAKVREATRYPNVKIVTTQWLVDCLTQWSHLDEEPYLLPVHPDDRGEPFSPGSRELAESSWLSSEDEASGSLWAEDEEGGEELFGSSGLETSPIGYDADEQAAVHDELKEFLGSDDESESDSEASFLADENAGSGKKRKRDEGAPIGENDEESVEDDDDESDIAGSRLSQRIKRSYERSTGLREVATANSSGTDETASERALPSGPDGEDPDASAAGARRGLEVSYPEDPADDDDEMEREMLAAFEDGDYDPKAEEDIAAENG